MQRPSQPSHLVNPTSAVAWLTFVLTSTGLGCGSSEGPRASSDQSATGTEFDGGTSPTAPASPGDAPIGQPLAPEELPTLTCEQRPPAAFSSQCTGCHTLSGA